MRVKRTMKLRPNNKQSYKNFTLFITIFLFIIFGDFVYAKKFALCIGVPYKGNLKLEYTKADATEFGNVLKSNFNFETKILVNEDETRKSSLEKEFEVLRGEIYDQLIIFFSGHGQKDPYSDNVGYLIPSDGDRKQLYSTTIPMSDIEYLGRSLRAHQLLFIIDACYSGIAATYTNMDISDREDVDPEVLSLKSRQIMTAGNTEQKARMYETLKLSVYTYFLKEALTFKPDPQSDFLLLDRDKVGTIPLWDLQSFVENKVSGYTREAQTPRLWNFTEDNGIFKFEYDVVINPEYNISDESFREMDLSAEDGRLIAETGKLLVTSYLDGKLSIDHEFRTNMKNGETRVFFKLELGKHVVELKDLQNTTYTETITILKGAKEDPEVIFDPTFASIVNAALIGGLVSSPESTGTLLVYYKGFDGQIIINGKSFGYLNNKNSPIKIDNLPEGTLEVKCEGTKRTLTQNVVINKNVISQVSFMGPPETPFNLHIVE
jgi:hypothetical protein